MVLGSHHLNCGLTHDTKGSWKVLGTSVQFAGRMSTHSCS